MSKVLGLGEILIDFMPVVQKEGTVFRPMAGGAPLNVLSALTRLGVSTGFIGAVGQDVFGRFLLDSLHHLGVDGTLVQQMPHHQTTLAFVHHLPGGEREFTFYRHGAADLQIHPQSIHKEMLQDVDIFHFGSLSLTENPAREATRHAVSLAKEQGVFISYDPNYRPLLWPSPEMAKEAMLSLMDQVSLVKLSLEELSFLTGEQDIQRASALLTQTYAIPLVLITAGSSGSYYRRGDDFRFVPGYPVTAVDTTGAGDGFLGAFLFMLLQKERLSRILSTEELDSCIDFANRYASIVVTKLGSADIMPTFSEIF